MDELMFMGMVFEHEELLRDAAKAVEEGMDIEQAAKEFCLDWWELKAYCRNRQSKILL